MWSEKARHALDAMEGDSEKTKISYFHHWFDGEGMGKIELWSNKKILLSQEEYDKLEEDEKEGKYSSEKIESYFILFESLLAPKSNPLLAVEELCFAKQGSMDSGECHAHLRSNLTIHHSDSPFVIRQPIHRPRLQERVYKPIRIHIGAESCRVYYREHLI